MRKLTLAFLMLVLVVVACGGGNADDQKEEPAPASGVSGNAANGEGLFSQSTIGSQPGCITCHSLEPDKVLVGPSLAGVAARAGSRVSGQSAEDYIRESILNTDAFTVDGFAAGVMPAALADGLSEQQLADLVAYLVTLK
jgi:mono/diheme cytochrome c family protein